MPLAGDGAEAKRLDEVLAYEVLRTEPEPEFDEITGLAGRLFDAPAAVLGVFGEDELWLKAACGWTCERFFRGGGDFYTLVSHLGSSGFLDDVRLADCEQVRSWAGVPIYSHTGFRVGILGVASPEPRHFDRNLAGALESLSRQAAFALANRKRINQMRKSLELRNRFLATLSHEIRTPLNGIVGAGELLSRSVLSPDQLGLVKAVRSSAELMLGLVNHVLDLNKVEAKGVQLSERVFPLRHCLESTIHNFAPLAESKEIELTLDWKALDEAHVNGDRLRTGQILSNLIGNAIKFTPKGGFVRVKAEALEREGAWEIEICDNGIGVPPGMEERIFTPFEQGGKEIGHNYGGTGLGLAISRELARAMGGDITVAPNAGGGSTFRCTLQFTLSTQLEHGLRILLAEDNPVNQFVARGMLRHLGCEVEIAGNGRLAIERLESVAFDLVLMDCQMPLLDGYAATREIRARKEAWSKIPILALTAHTRREEWQKCLDCGMNGFVPKPIELEVMKREIFETLRTRGLV